MSPKIGKISLGYSIDNKNVFMLHVIPENYQDQGYSIRNGKLEKLYGTHKTVKLDNTIQIKYPINIKFPKILNIDEFKKVIEKFRLEICLMIDKNEKFNENYLTNEIYAAGYKRRMGLYKYIEDENNGM
jgi:hypothetical protein